MVDTVGVAETSGILTVTLGRTVGADVSGDFGIREHVDDYVNLLMTDSDGIVFDYNDGLNQLTAAMDIDGLPALPIIADDDTLAIYDEDADEIRKVSSIELEREIRIHRGQWDSTINYAQGWIAETGVSTSKEFWIAGVNIIVGNPEPTLADPHNWYLLAGRTHFRGLIDHTITHNVLDGTWFRVDDQVFMATASITGLTGDDALGGHDDVIELTMVPNPSAAPTERLLTLGYDGVSYGVRDTKAVTALPDAVDVADADKDKLWLVVPTADEGIVEVAHFAPADDPEIFKMTAQAFMQGPASYVGYDVTDNGGHLEPSDTNIERIAFGHTFSNYEIEFNENKTSPFDYNDYSSDGLNLYFREEGTTGNWQRFLLEIPNANDTHEYGSAISQTNHFVAGTTYDVIIRTTGVSGNQAVSTVPTSDRLQSHPAGGAFKSFVDEDDLGHVTVVVETNREVDGEVDSVALAVSSGDLTVTVGRTASDADLTATAGDTPRRHHRPAPHRRHLDRGTGDNSQGTWPTWC